MADRLRLRLGSFSRALDRLEEALTVPADAPLALDGTIQRFEFTFELAWKSLKDGLALEGVDARSPRSSLREAFRLGWLESEETWLQMLDDRNAASHVYREEVAKELYGRLPTHARSLRAAYEVLRRQDLDAGTP